MSLGSRIVKPGKAAIVASLRSTPREPLLFLYPQWLRNPSTLAAQPALFRDGRLPISFTRAYSSDTAADALVESPPESGPVELERDIPSEETDDPSHGEGYEARGPSVDPDIVEDHRVEPPASKGQEKSPVVRLYAAHPSPFFRKRIDRMIKVQKQVEKNKRLKRAFRRVYQETKREMTQSWVPDWRIILDDLRRRTLRHDEWFDQAVSISVPESAGGTLLHAVDDNIWDIADKHNCSVALANRDASTDQYNKFILSGSALAISKVAAEAMRIAPGSKLKKGPKAHLSTGPNGKTSPPTAGSDEELSSDPNFRFVKAEVRDKFPATRPEMIPKPSEWTTRTFADYVDTVTSMQMPNHMHHLLYKKPEVHVKTVVNILREIFTDPKCKSSLSRTAFNKALAYFVKTSSIADARATFVLMDIMGIQMNPETFNIMLRGAAKNEDLHNFHYILHLMFRRGISPNGNTWVAFLMANHDYRIKPYIVAEMKEKGLLAHPGIIRRVCQELLLREVNASLDAAQSQDDFLAHMDSRYGVDWLTVDNGNRVLHALGARNLISRCWEFLQAMNARFVKIDHVSINTILNHCKQQTNVAGAVEIMRLLPTLYPSYIPDQDTYHSLFELAWRTRSYNLARVVWKYACLNARTTRRMRLLVSQSLINAVLKPGPEASQRKIWRQQAGLVITNDVFDHPTPQLKKPSDDQQLSGFEIEASPLNELFQPRSVSGIEVTRAVHDHLERDYAIFKAYDPTRPFGDMLLQAWEKDRDWQTFRMQIKGGENIDWKLEEAIVVPVHSRRGGQGRIMLDWR